jgi:homoserine acetyltransferase
MMDCLVAMVPLAKTPAWTVAVLETTRKAIMLDPAWNGGNYAAIPEKGVRLWRDILNLLSARTPDMYQAQFKNGMDVLPWMTQQEDAENIRCQRLDLSDLGLREARCWYDAGLQWRHRESTRFNKGENLDPHRYQGFAQSRIRAAVGCAGC